MINDRSPGRVKKKMKISGRQVMAARNLLGLTQDELATAASVDRTTVLRFETGQIEPQRASLKKIQDELERRGIEFTNGTGVGVRINYEKAAEYARTAVPARNESDR
jgi:transcriptional regulator with XRE-family HTH domain